MGPWEQASAEVAFRRATSGETHVNDLIKPGGSHPHSPNVPRPEALIRSWNEGFLRRKRKLAAALMAVAAVIAAGTGAEFRQAEALEPLTPEQRRMFVDTLEAYEQGLE